MSSGALQDFILEVPDINVYSVKAQIYVRMGDFYDELLLSLWGAVVERISFTMNSPLLIELEGITFKLQKGRGRMG